MVDANTQQANRPSSISIILPTRGRIKSGTLEKSLKSLLD